MKGRSTYYAFIFKTGKRPIPLHRVLLNPPANKVVDHINGNGLDNRRANLRICTDKQNHHNMRKYDRCMTVFRSPYKGTCWDKRFSLWRAYIKHNGKVIHLGYFRNPHDGATAYNEAAKKYYGEYARLNVIESVPDWRKAYAHVPVVIPGRKKPGRKPANSERN